MRLMNGRFIDNTCVQYVVRDQCMKRFNNRSHILIYGNMESMQNFLKHVNVQLLCARGRLSSFFSFLFCQKFRPFSARQTGRSWRPWDVTRSHTHTHTHIHHTHIHRHTRQKDLESRVQFENNRGGQNQNFNAERRLPEHGKCFCTFPKYR